MAKDRTELNDLAKAEPETVASLKAKREPWSGKVNVLAPEKFEAARKAFRKKKKK